MANSNLKETSQPKSLFLILGGIVIAVVAWQMAVDTFSIKESMRLFIGLVFLIFGFFKILDWHGFAAAFAKYDIIGHTNRSCAYLYPVIELSLGAAYLLNIMPTLVNVITVVLISIRSISMFKVIKKDKKIDCACLGTMIKLPLTMFTFVEGIGIGLMALSMIFM